jgi:hypothetical protein
MVRSWMLYFAWNLQYTQLHQTCALNHKPVVTSTLNCILCDKKDSLQNAPDFISQTLTFRGVWPCSCWSGVILLYYISIRISLCWVG